MLLGQSKGKVGSLVFYRRNGKQVTRALAASVSNPNSEAQAIQRMIFGTVTAAFSRMQSICNHSFEGVKYGAPSQAKFMQDNLKRLRAFYPIDVAMTTGGLSPADEPDLADIMAYADKGNAEDSGVGLIIARGSLPQVPVIKDSSADGKLVGFGTEFEGQTIAEVLNALGAVAGDQITICALVSVMDGEPMFVKSRYVVDVAATSEQLSATWTADGSAAAFDSSKTLINPLLTLTVDAGVTSEKKMCIVTPATNYILIGAGVILSRKSESNKWLRSNAILYNALDEHPTDSASAALPSWQAGTTVIQTEDARYLNNADLGE